MPTIEEIQAKCPDVSFRQKDDGKWTCRFYRDHVCIAAGHKGGDCLVFPRQETLGLEGGAEGSTRPLPVAELAQPVAESAEPASDVLGLEDSGGDQDTGEAQNGAQSPGSVAAGPQQVPAPENQSEPGTNPSRDAWDMTWSPSRVGMFLRCPYKFYLHYIEGLTVEPRPDWAVYGSAMHEALENYTRRGELLFEATGRPEVDAKVAGTLDGLMVTGTLDQIRNEVPWIVEGKVNFEYEHEPEYVQSNRLRWTTRLDLLSQDEHIIADYKSTGGDVSKIRSIDVLYQMSAYMMAKPRSEQVCIHAIFKPRLKKKARETWGEFRERVRQDVLDHPDKYYLPHRFSRAEIQPEKHFAVLCDTVARIIECIKQGEGAFPRNAGDCSFGAPCEYERECMRRV